MADLTKTQTTILSAVVGTTVALAAIPALSMALAGGGLWSLGSALAIVAGGYGAIKGIEALGAEKTKNTKLGRAAAAAAGVVAVGIIVAAYLPTVLPMALLYNGPLLGVPALAGFGMAAAGLVYLCGKTAKDLVVDKGVEHIASQQQEQKVGFSAALAARGVEPTVAQTKAPPPNETPSQAADRNAGGGLML
jgi:hypothetical protein